MGKSTVPQVSWRTAQVSLMRSRFTSAGASYEVLATFPLRMMQTNN